MRTLRAWCTQCTLELTKESDLRGQDLADAADVFQADVGKRHAKEANPQHIVRVQYSVDLRQDSAPFFMAVFGLTAQRATPLYVRKRLD